MPLETDVDSTPVGQRPDEDPSLAARTNGGREPSGKSVVALLSDWCPATTGEIVHVDGGFHAVGV